MTSLGGEELAMTKSMTRMLVDPTCVCEQQIVAEVQYINQTTETLGGAVIPGLSHQDTALLAGILTGLAAFLFLALPILCCLCPLPCAICGGGGAGAGAGKGSKANRGARGGTESVRSSFSEMSISKYGGGGKASLWEPAGGGLILSDMKIPRARADSLSKSLDDYDSRWRQGGEGDWEGLDVQRLEQQLQYGGGGGGGNNGTGSESYHHTMSRMAQGQSGGGGGGVGGGVSGGVSHGDDGVVEYETTRQITIESFGVPEVTTQRTFEAMASGLPQQEYIYETAMRQQHIDGGVERIRLG